MYGNGRLEVAPGRAAGQRFEGDRLAAAELNDRLVDRSYLASVQDLAQGQREIMHLLLLDGEAARLEVRLVSGEIGVGV